LSTKGQLVLPKKASQKITVVLSKAKILHQQIENKQIKKARVIEVQEHE